MDGVRKDGIILQANHKEPVKKLNQIKKITLIYPPYGAVKNEPGIKAVKENYGVFPSLSLAYVGGVIEKAGIQLQFIDANALCLSTQETIRRIKNFNPDMLGFTITTYLFYQTLSWVKELRDKTGIPTLLGGVHMGIYPDETFSHKEIDFGVVGEAEETVPEFIKAINTGGDLATVKGLIWRNGDEVVINECRPLFMDVNNSPLPCRNHLPNDKYFSFISQFKNFSPIITSRGCPFQCIFCEQGGLKFRPRDPQHVADEIEECYHVYKVRELDFFDSSFTVQKQRVISICDELTKRHLNGIYWAIRSRVDLVDKEMLYALNAAGCKRIYYGIESSDPGILKTLQKSVDVQNIREVIKMTNDVGIDTFGYFMVGSPGETEETVENTIRFAVDLNLDYAQFSKVTPMPATKLYEMVKEDYKQDFWKEYILDPEMEIYIPRPRTNLDEQQVQALTRKAYLKFYFRPKYILKALWRLKSFGELKRSVYTAWSMFWERNKVFERSWTKKIQY